MELFPELEKRYTKDQYTAREAQRMAEFIAFGPIVFQASRLLVKYGILELLREHREGLTRIEVTEAYRSFRIYRQMPSGGRSVHRNRAC